MGCALAIARSSSVAGPASSASTQVINGLDIGLNLAWFSIRTVPTL